LTRATFRDTKEPASPITSAALTLTEVADDGLVCCTVHFDLNDFDAAVAELDARYLAGEASPHAHTWTAVTNGYAALNRHELPPTTPDWVSIDHRLGPSFAPGDFIEYSQAAFDLAPEIRIYIEAVHRLTDTGAIVSHVARGASRDGFEAEWSEISLLLFDRERATRCELFDGADPRSSTGKIRRAQSEATT
jgi:hypothetical protein